MWEATVVVPGYEPRRVQVELAERNPNWPSVFADGPRTWEDSPHRYAMRGRTKLCIWLPDDDVSRRWVPSDGLVMLFGMAAHHLFKEAWWRETGGRAGGEWLGDEAPHGELTEQDDVPPEETEARG